MTSPTALLLTRDAYLVTRVQTLTPADVTVTIATPDAAIPGQPLPTTDALSVAPAAPVLLVGDDVAAEMAHLDPDAYRLVIVLCPCTPSVDVWRHAIALGATNIAILPEGERWLIEQLAEHCPTKQDA